MSDYASVHLKNLILKYFKEKKYVYFLIRLLKYFNAFMIFVISVNFNVEENAVY